jgi:hypothetical protein
MEPWPGEEAFVKCFNQVKATSVPLSGSKIQEIALAAFTDLKVSSSFTSQRKKGLFMLFY